MTWPPYSILPPAALASSRVLRYPCVPTLLCRGPYLQQVMLHAVLHVTSSYRVPESRGSLILFMMEA